MSGNLDHAISRSASLKLRHVLAIVCVGLGGLGVTGSPRDPRFAGSNPAEVDGFLSGRKNPEHKSSGRDFKLESEISGSSLKK